MSTLPVLRARKGENLLRVQKITVFELRNLFVKAILGAELRLQHLVNEIRRLPKGFIRLTTTENAEGESDRIFHLLNLFLLVCLILLSPDRIVQVFSPTQSGYEIIRGFHDAVEMLRKLAMS
jgi:hypothetical protein